MDALRFQAQKVVRRIAVIARALVLFWRIRERRRDVSTRESRKRIGLRAALGMAVVLLACPWASSGQESDEDFEAAAESAALQEFLIEQEAEALRENIQPSALVKIKI